MPSKVLFEKLRPYLIFALLFLVGVYRFSLIDRGALSTPDEVRYWDAADAWEKLVAKRDVRGFFISFASATNGRTIGTNKPGDTTLRLIPSFFQGVLWKLSGGIYARDPQLDSITSGIHFRNPESLKIPASFNVILSLLLLWVFYQISLLLFRGEVILAFLGTLVYGLLANSNIYIRHILPYDSALLFFLLGLYRLLKDINLSGHFSLKTCFWGGVLTGFGFSIYPGYYLLPVVIFSLICFIPGLPLWSKIKFACALTFAGGFLAVLFFYEAIAWLGSTHYLLHLPWYFGKQDQGSFEEGFTFFPKYLLEVETGIGAFLLIFCIFYILRYIFQGLRWKKEGMVGNYHPQLAVLFFTAFAGFMMHAIFSVTGKMVFYGRLLHMYFPFLVWAVMAVLSDIQVPGLRRILLYGAVFFLSLASFIKFAFAYYQIGYPLDILYKLRIQTENIGSGNIIYESNPDLIFSSPPARNQLTGAPYQDASNLLLINFCSFRALKENDFYPFVPSKRARLVYRQPHFDTFPAYAYEAFSIEERHLLQERNYQVSVYELMVPPAGA